MRKRLILLLVLVALAGLIVSGCVPSKTVIVYKAPPPPRYEKPAVCPGPVYVWIVGHWVWKPRPGKYVWVSGHWAKRSPGKVWVSGQWKKYRGGWVWITGQWR